MRRNTSPHHQEALVCHSSQHGRQTVTRLDIFNDTWRVFVASKPTDYPHRKLDRLHQWSLGFWIQTMLFISPEPSGFVPEPETEHEHDLKKKKRPTRSDWCRWWGTDHSPHRSQSSCCFWYWSFVSSIRCQRLLKKNFEGNYLSIYLVYKTRNQQQNWRLEEMTNETQINTLKLLQTSCDCDHDDNITAGS